MTSKNTLTALLACAAVLAQSESHASITATDILNILVEENVLSEEKAKALIEKARQRSNREDELAKNPPPESTKPTVRVPYVPEFIKSTIKEAVRNEVLVDIEEQVARRAIDEGWVVNQTPSWTKRIKVSGDVRFRYQEDRFPSDNPTLQTDPNNLIFDINAINDAGGVEAAGISDAFVNASDDRQRMRTRARIKVEGKPHKEVKAVARLVTGGADDPVSTNQTLGQFGSKYDANFDLAYVQYQMSGEQFRFVGGRFENPWVSSGLIWDNDLTFEGVSVGLSPFGLKGSVYAKQIFDPFLTLGAFPIDEIRSGLRTDSLSQPKDKWLYGLQIGNRFRFNDANRFNIALAYYQFDNITGQRNPVGEDINNETASSYYQFGNTLFDIANPSATQNNDADLYALASEFELINLNLAYIYSGFLRHKIGLTADWVQNVGFDQDEIEARIGPSNSVPSRDIGYQYGFSFGTKFMRERWDWNTSFTYRYLEGDAVVDAFADSDFLFGGTNAKGYIIQGDLLFAKNTTITFKWLSAEDIDAVNVFDEEGNAVVSNVESDTFQLDFKVKF